MSEVLLRGVWSIDRDIDTVFDAMREPERWCGLDAHRVRAGDQDGVDGVVQVRVPTRVAGSWGSGGGVLVDVATVDAVRPWRVRWQLSGGSRGLVIWELDSLAEVTDVSLELQVAHGSRPARGPRWHRTEQAVVAAIERAARGLAREVGGDLRRAITTEPGSRRRFALETRPGLASW